MERAWLAHCLYSDKHSISPILFLSCFYLVFIFFPSPTRMPPIHLAADGITKRFDRRVVLHNVSFTAQSGSLLGITGHNGAGKSTLMKILAGVLSPTSGSVTCVVDDTPLDDEARPQQMGFVAPYLALYEEFSPLELMHHVVAMRGLPFDAAFAETLLHVVGLHERRHDDIRSFSSGMKQRAKYALALVHRPPILLLDEPMTNLDASGISVVERCIAEQRSTGGIVLLATNDERDIALCDSTVSVEPA
jgi:heme exporter protein A